MLIIEGVLNPEALERVRAGLAEAAFQDGRVTATGSARAVKRNAEVGEADAGAAALRRLVRQTLAAHAQFDGYARPVRWSQLIFSRCPGRRLRRARGRPLHARRRRRGDARHLSFTLLLDDPASYEGGELVLDTQRRPQGVKLAAASVVIYPTSVLHALAPVRWGVRRAAVGCSRAASATTTSACCCTISSRRWRACRTTPTAAAPPWRSPI